MKIILTAVNLHFLIDRNHFFQKLQNGLKLRIMKMKYLAMTDT